MISILSRAERVLSRLFLNEIDFNINAINQPIESIEAQPQKSPSDLEEEFEKEIEILISQEDLIGAITLLSRAALEFSASQDFLGKQIYLPKLDALVEKLSKNILNSFEDQSGNLSSHKHENSPLGRPIILATELYFEGGHSRIAEELIRLFPSAILILTNFFDGSSRPPKVLPNGLKDLPMLVLPNDTAVNNIIRLNNLCKILGSRMYHLGHHHDVVLNAAICSNIDIPVYFIHHSDHKPSLGNTIKSFIHVDIVRHIHSLCSSNLDQTPIYWPQGVKDFGRKEFHYPIRDIVTASSGSHTKFSWCGDESYPIIIRKLLQNDVDMHFHIGSLEPFQEELILAQLSEYEIDPGRMRFIGPVESLWKALLEYPINCYIGSSLIHGLRTAIEVQGASIPIFPYLQSVELPFMLEGEHYNSEALFWSSADELCKQIHLIMLTHESASSSARKFYEANFTVTKMKEAMLTTDGGGR